MQIAIIGAGNVGAAMARALTDAGHAVTFGARDPSKIEGPIPAAAVADAAAGAELVVFAVPSSALAAAAASAGDLSGKILVDATNPLRWDAGPVHAPPPEGSNAARLQALAPGARVVKAFNTFGAEYHAASQVAGAPVTLLVTGDDADAKRAVADLAAGLGYAPVDAGPLRNAAAQEQHAILWIHLATVGGRGRRFTFQLVDDA